MQISKQFERVKVDDLADNFAKIVRRLGRVEDCAPRTAPAWAAARRAKIAAPWHPPPWASTTRSRSSRSISRRRPRRARSTRSTGRDEEIRQIVDILMRRRQNNPILTGEAGVGKTAVVEGFAQRLARGDVPPQLKDVKLLTLDIGLLQAGASMKGEFEQRLRQVIDEVQASPEADHPVHRRDAYAGRRGRRGRYRRCGQSAQAGAGARQPAHHRRDHLGRVQEAHRERPGADPALPGRAGARARRGQGDPDDARAWPACSKSTTACRCSTRRSKRPSSCRIATFRRASCPTRR